MSTSGDARARLLCDDRVQSLSGTSSTFFIGTPGMHFFDTCLRSHHAGDDLVANPDQVWGNGHMGLSQHVAEHSSANLTGFTDAVVIVSNEDWNRMGDPSAWVSRATQTLAKRWAAAHGAKVRPPGLRVLKDGSPELHGDVLGIAPSSFVTGLVPNLYVAGPDSEACVRIHANIPGEWEGYKEAGRLYKGQNLFTVGSHWLDTFGHPSLIQPMLYRLAQEENGELVHVVHPELQSRIRIHSRSMANGVRVVTLTDHKRGTLLHLVLEVISGPSTTDPSQDGTDPLRISDLNPTSNTTPPTAVPQAIPSRVMTLSEQGALLQRVHFNREMSGYDVFLGTQGEICTRMAAPAATIQVRHESSSTTVRLLASSTEVGLDGKEQESGAIVDLNNDTEISLGDNVLSYRDLSDRNDLEAWPYVGEIRRRSGSTYLAFGEVYSIGREEDCDVNLPNVEDDQNIHWTPRNDENVVLTQRGALHRSRFSTDAIMVSKVHARIDLSGDPQLANLARQCSTYVRRAEKTLAIGPDETNGTNPQTLALWPGDEILVGNSVFRVSYPPAMLEKIPEAPVEPPVFGAELPVAAGLGERGPGPTPMQVSLPSSDSILDTEPLIPLPVPVDDDLPTPGPMQLPDGVDATSLPEDEPPPLHFDMGPDTFMAERAEFSQRQSILASIKRQAPKRVVNISETRARNAIGMPARLVTDGWVLSGPVLVANHSHAQAVIPELTPPTASPLDPPAHFPEAEYFRITVDHGTAKALRLAHADAELTSAGSEQDLPTPPNILSIVRRNGSGQQRFTVQLTLQDDADNPIEGASRLSIASGDPEVSLLFTTGLEPQTPKRVDMGPIRAVANFDGEQLILSDYLTTYRLPDGNWERFLVRSRETEEWIEAPQDGAAIVLDAGESVLAGHVLVRFEK